MGVKSTGPYEGTAMTPPRNEGFLAVGERILKVEIGKERAAEMGLVHTLKNLIHLNPDDDNYYLSKAERGFTKESKWRKEYDERLPVLVQCAKLFGQEHPKLLFFEKHLSKDQLAKIASVQKYPVVAALIARVSQSSDETSLLEQVENLLHFADLIPQLSEEDKLVLQRLNDLPGNPTLAGLKKAIAGERTHLKVLDEYGKVLGHGHPKLPFIEKHLPKDYLPKIAAVQKYPVVAALIARVSQNNDEKSLREQLENLALLADQIPLLSDEDKILLQRLNDLPKPAKLKEALEGIKAEGKAELKALEARRKTAAVSTKAIELQAGLFAAIREGKRWAKKQATLAPQGDSHNLVHKLYRENEPGIAAFYKVGHGGEEAAGKMEKLMWDIAVILGFEESFVATGEADITLGKDKSHGGIQPAQPAKNLADSRGKALPRAEILQGILISILLGMYDAHDRNIFITPENKIKFFDNTRSLPRSNGYIYFDNVIVPAFRCALLDLPEAKQPLLPDEIAALKEQLALIQQKMLQLKSFLTSPQTQAMGQKLPPGWLDVDASLHAMEERIQGLNAALNTGAIHVAEDLARHFDPEYRFAFASTYLFARHYNLPDHAAIPHNVSGFKPLSEIWPELTKEGYDLTLLRSWSDTMTLDALAKKIETNFTSLRRPGQAAANNALIANCSQKAALDLKDHPRADCVTFVHQWNITALQKEPHVKIGKMGEAEAHALFEHEHLSSLVFSPDGIHSYLIHGQPPVVEPIDLTVAPDKIKIGARLVPINSL